MKFLQITKLFYYVYTIYTLLIVLMSNYPIIYAFIGLLVMWMLYFMVLIGYKSVTISWCESDPSKIKQTFLFSSIPNWPVMRYVINACICWGCTIMASKYYTGKTFFQVINSLLGSRGAYQSYQTYFREMNIATFSLQKIPYILMLGYLTIMLFWGLVSIIQLTNQIKTAQYFYLISLVLSYLYFGGARGTNFELYTVFILIAYCLLNREKNKANQQINSRGLFLVFILGCVLIVVFLITVGARGGSFSYKICGEIQYDPERTLSKVFPRLSIVLKSLFSYLGFGIYTIGVSFCDIVPQNFMTLISFLVPGHGLVDDYAIANQLRNSVEMGARWTPDILFMVDSFGLIVSMLIWVVIGRTVKKIQMQNIPRMLKELINIILYIQMLSFPVGNFLGASTPNTILVLFVLLCYLGTKIRVVVRH